MNPFEDALELFGDNGEHWTQGHGVQLASDGTISYCSDAALAVTVGYYETSMVDRYEVTTIGTVTQTVRCAVLVTTGADTERALTDARRTLAARIEHPSVVLWNDDPSRTFEDVRLAFKHCAQLWEEQA